MKIASEKANLPETKTLNRFWPVDPEWPSAPSAKKSNTKLKFYV